MSKHLQRDMDLVHRDVLSLSATVEEMIDKATQALSQRAAGLAEHVIATDPRVDEREVHIEEECLKILALHQPVASDLRRIATVVKANGDLERIGDLAVNVAQRAKCLREYPAFPMPRRLPRMVTLAVGMVRGALDAFVNLASAEARRICMMDDDVDELNRLIIEELLSLMESDPDMVRPGLHCFSATRQIERIADHATNIAEDVIYLVEGEIVRHRRGLVARVGPNAGEQHVNMPLQTEA
jgi:phosphate transport system protein